MLNNRGLKILPPPSPSAPATHPPVNPRASTFLRTVPLKMRSLLAKFKLPYFSLRDYSKAIIPVLIFTTRIMIRIKIVRVIQSPTEHFSITPDLELLRYEIARSSIRETQFINCFLQTP